MRTKRARARARARFKFILKFAPEVTGADARLPSVVTRTHAPCQRPSLARTRQQEGEGTRGSRAYERDERQGPPLTGVKPKARCTARGVELRRAAPRSLDADWPARNPRQRAETS